MLESSINKKRLSFKSNPLISGAVFLDERLMLNKATLDASVDVPMVMMANNKTERAERFNRCAIAWTIAFATPFVTLPLTNRLAMKYIAGASKKLMSEESKLIELSNKYLVGKNETKKGIEEFVKNYKVSKLDKFYAGMFGKKPSQKAPDFREFITNNNGDFEKIRKKLVNAKMSVLAFDLAFTAGSLGSIGFFNNWRTKRKTGREGFSAEFNMADQKVTDERAKKYAKTEGLRKASFAALVGLITLMPLAIKKGLNTKETGKFGKFVKKHAHLTDYTDGIFMHRLPLFFAAISAYYGMSVASRNKTELKDNLIRAMVGQFAFFGGDIVIGSTLARISDKLFKTELLDKTASKSFMNKIIPPTRPLKELPEKSKKIGSGLFWLNLALLSLTMGFGTPYLINKMIKKDVKKDTDKDIKTTTNFSDDDYLKNSLEIFLNYSEN